MHFVLRGERVLSVVHARALVSQLDLPPEQAEHLLGMFELPHLPPKLARERRERLLAAMSATRGVPWGPYGSLLEHVPADEATIMALAPALACLEEDRPTLGKLLRSAVPPVTRAHLTEALTRPPCWTRTGSRRVTLSLPGPSQGAGWAHQGMLAFAQEALLRLPAAQRELRAFVTSLDAQGSLALEEACRWSEAELVQLAEEAELRKPDRVLALCTQRFVAAGPFPEGASTGEARWRSTGVQLPPLEGPSPPSDAATDPQGPTPPHPIGVTWFPTWVKIWRTWAAQAQQPHSDAWLAEQTGLARSTVYDLCSGATRFSSQHIYRFLKPFGLEKDRLAQAALEGMAMVAAPEGPRHQAALIAALRAMGAERQQRHYETEAHFVQSQWFAQVIYVLTDLAGFRPLEGWLCRALKGRVEWQGAREALIALGVVGLLRQDAAGRAVPIAPLVRVEGPHDAISQVELHDGLLSLYRAELDGRDPDLQSEITTMALPEKAMPRFWRIQEEGRARIYAVLEDAEKRRAAGAPMDRVVIASRQIFPLFRLRA